MKKSTDLRAQRTQGWLKAALREMMQEKQYKKIRISEIVIRAGVARPTFYLHYESKDELLLSLFDNLFSEFRTALSSELLRHNVDLQLFGEMIFSYGREHAKDIRILLDAGVEHLVQERFRVTMLELSEEVRAIDPIDPQAAALMPYIDEFLASGIFMLLKRWIQDDMSIPSETLGLLIGEVATALRAIAVNLPTPKARAMGENG